MSFRRKFAVLVGVTDYQQEKLSFCRLDVEILADVLSKKGFKCSSFVDVDLRPILNDLKSMAAEATTPEDVIVFYFSGHGADVLGEQLLLGRGGNLSSLSHALRDGDLLMLSEVLEALADSPALKLVVVDACRTLANVRQEDLERFGPNIVEQRRKAFQHIANCVVTFASADGQKSRGDDDKGSLFTLQLAAELKEYRCDIVHAVQNAISALRSANAAQIPWIYASTYSSVMPDRLRLTEKVDPGSFTRPIADKFMGFSAGAVHGLKKNTLVKFDGHRWQRISTVLHCGDLVTVAFARDVIRLAAVRGKSVYATTPLASDVGVEKSTQIEFRRLGGSRLQTIFGVAISPLGDAVAVYGAANGVDTALTCWRSEADGSKKLMLIEGTVGDQCNAAQWTSSKQLFTSFSRKDSERSSIVGFDVDINGKLQGAIIAITDFRVVSLEAVNGNTLCLGDTSGGVSFLDYKDGMVRRLERKHPLDPVGAPCGKKGWKGAGDDFLSRTPAVTYFAHHPGMMVLAVGYFDQTIAFIDLMSETFIKDFGPSRYPRAQPISRTAIDSFMVLRGHGGTEFTIEYD